MKLAQIETHVEKWIDEECPVGERVVFLQRADDRLAILGIVGSRSASVGRNEDGKLYFWRKGSTLNYTHGNLEGENLVKQVKNLAEDWQVGSKQICDSKKWIVMEFYRKYLIGHS